MKKFSQPAERNKGPITNLLVNKFKGIKSALEIASGSGQHIVTYAEAMTTTRWTPSDRDEDCINSINEYINESDLKNISPPVLIDCSHNGWDVGIFDLIISVNMIHIAPYEACIGLFRNAQQHLVENGHLALYGPFFDRVNPIAESNLSFDQWLKQRDGSWGVRHLEDVAETADEFGFHMISSDSMPANNLTVIFCKK